MDNLRYRTDALIEAAGDTIQYQMQIMDEATDTVYTMTTGDVLTFKLRPVCRPERVVTPSLVKEFLTTTIKLLPEDTLGLEPGRYEYAVALTMASGEHYTLIPWAPFVLLQGV